MKKKFLTVGAASIALLAFTSLSVMAQKNEAPRTAGRQAGASETYKALNLFGDVFELTRSNYVEKVTDKKLVEYALNGMLSNLDPHSSYMDAEESESMSIQNKGEFGGLGIDVTMENGVVKVVTPIDDTPAAKAGFISGDLIIEIDGQQVMGMTLSDAVEKMRGKVGSEVRLTVVRQGAKEPMKFKLIRDIIQIKSVKSRVENGNVGYIRVTQFNAQTDVLLKKSFENIHKEAGDKLIGYVLDLRNNPGGLLDQGVAVADAFLEQGEIVSRRGRNTDDVKRDNATPGDLANGLPVITVVNGGSASASEIVAGALQDHKRAVILGTQTFGKGSVQTLFKVPGGGSVKITTARYFTPSGRSIQGTGISPDVKVERAKIVEEKDSPLEYHEKDLKGALKNPQEGSENPTLLPDNKTSDDNSGKAPTDKKPDSKDDYQLQRAIDLLEGIAVYRKGDTTIADSKAATTKPTKAAATDKDPADTPTIPHND